MNDSWLVELDTSRWSSSKENHWKFQKLLAVIMMDHNGFKSNHTNLRDSAAFEFPSSKMFTASSVEIECKLAWLKNHPFFRSLTMKEICGADKDLWRYLKTSPKMIYVWATSSSCFCSLGTGTSFLLRMIGALLYFLYCEGGEDFQSQCTTEGDGEPEVDSIPFKL